MLHANEHTIQSSSRRYTEAVRDTSASSSVQTVERLLTALAALNKIWYVCSMYRACVGTCVTDLHCNSLV